MCVNAQVEQWIRYPPATWLDEDWNYPPDDSVDEPNPAFVVTDKFSTAFPPREEFVMFGAGFVRDKTPPIHDQDMIAAGRWNRATSRWVPDMTLVNGLNPITCRLPKIDVTCGSPVSAYPNDCWMIMGCFSGRMYSYRWDERFDIWNQDLSLLNGIPLPFPLPGSRWGVAPSINYNPLSNQWELLISTSNYSYPNYGFVWNERLQRWEESGDINWNMMWFSAPQNGSWATRPDMTFNVTGNDRIINFVGKENWALPFTSHTWIDSWVLSDSGYWYQDPTAQENLDSVWGYRDGCTPTTSTACYEPGAWNEHWVKATSGKNLLGNDWNWLFVSEHRNDWFYAFYWFDNKPPMISDIAPPVMSHIGEGNDFEHNMTHTITFSIHEKGDCYALNRKTDPVNPSWGYDEIKSMNDSGNPYAVDCEGDGTTSISCTIPTLESDSCNITLVCKDRKGNKDTSRSATHFKYIVDTTPPLVRHVPSGDSTPANGSYYPFDLLPTNPLELEMTVEDEGINGVGPFTGDGGIAVLFTNETGSWKAYDKTEWHDENQPYRTEVRFRSPFNNYEVVNYTLAMTLSHSDFTGMAPDFADVRFYDFDGNELSYWREDYVEGDWALIKVRVPKLYASSSVVPHKVFMYYGNGTYGTASDPVATLPYYNDFSSAPTIECGSCDPTQDIYCWEDERNSSFDYNPSEEALEFKSHSRNSLILAAVLSEHIEINAGRTSNPHFRIKIRFDRADHTRVEGAPVSFGLSTDKGFFNATEGTGSCDSSFVGFRVPLTSRADVNGVRASMDEVPLSAYIRTPEGEIWGGSCAFVDVDSDYREAEVFVNGSDLLFYLDGSLCDKIDVSKLKLKNFDWKYFVAMAHQNLAPRRIVSAAYFPVCFAEGHLDDLIVENKVPIPPDIILRPEERRDEPGAHYGVHDSPQVVWSDPFIQFNWSNTSSFLEEKCVAWKVLGYDAFGSKDESRESRFCLAESNVAPNITMMEDNSSGSFSQSTLPIQITEGEGLSLRAWGNDSDCNFVNCLGNDPYGNRLAPSCNAGPSDCSTLSNSTMNWTVLDGSLALVGNRHYAENPTNHDFTTSGDFPKLNNSSSPYFVYLRFNDSMGLYDEDFWMVEVSSIPQNDPVADADGSYSCMETGSVILNGSLSTDADAFPNGCSGNTPCGQLTYSWEILEGVNVVGSANGRIQNFLCSSVGPGTYTVRLTVEDITGRTDTDTSSLRVDAMLPPSDLVVSDIDFSEPFQVRTKSNFTVTVSNKGTTDSSDYTDIYSVRPLAGGDDVINGTWTSPGLPGGTSRKNMTFWVPRQEGDYLVNFTVAHGLQRNYSTSIVFVRDVTETTGSEYPPLALATLLVLVPVFAYYARKKRCENVR